MRAFCFLFSSTFIFCAIRGDGYENISSWMGHRQVGITVPLSYELNSIGLEKLRNVGAQSQQSWSIAVSKTCGHPISMKSLSSEWNHDSLCKSWVPFSQLGTFAADDYKMFAPRHMSNRGTVWYLYLNEC
jgi:hypothetical protein